MIAAFRTVVFFVGWVLLTCVIGFAALPLLVSQRITSSVARSWARLTIGWLRLSCGIRTEQRGVVQGQLIACKHQSALDTLMLWCALNGPAFVLKRELYWIPIFGWYLHRTGQIAIDRSDGRSAMAQIAAQAEPMLAAGRAILIFPEGTRVRPGERRPFRPGIARVSAMLRLPVTPAALNAGYFWPKHSLVKKPGLAVLEFLLPVPVCDDQETWLPRLETIINDASERLAPRAEQLAVAQE